MEQPLTKKYVLLLYVYENVCFKGLPRMSPLSISLSRFFSILDNEQMLQKLGKKHLLLPAAPLWPGEPRRTGARQAVLPGALGAAAGEH